jgi:hypothetical protein
MNSVEEVSARIRPAPRWAVLAAHLAALTPLPSAIWRLLLMFEFTAGYTDEGFVALNIGAVGWLYLLALSVFTELAALLTLGLVQPWGQVVPRGVPYLGGRDIPSTPIIFAAALGAVALTVLWTPLLTWWSIEHSDLTPAGNIVIGLIYLPLVAWGPLLAAVTVSYARRQHPSTSARASKSV